MSAVHLSLLDECDKLRSENDALQSRLKRALDALRPLSDVAEWFPSEIKDETFIRSYSAVSKKSVTLTLNHCRAARAVLKLVWILFEHLKTKQDCIDAIIASGILLPEMYRLGFDNNNCPGCVKATSPWYWDMVRTHFPEVFARRAAQSRKLGVRLVRVRSKRIFLDELPAGPFKKFKKGENLSCGPECGLNMKEAA